MERRTWKVEFYFACNSHFLDRLLEQRAFIVDSIAPLGSYSEQGDGAVRDPGPSLRKSSKPSVRWYSRGAPIV